MADGQCYEELRVWKLELGPNLDLFGIIWLAIYPCRPPGNVRIGLASNCYHVIEPSPSPSSPSRCSTPRTWWPPATPDTAGTSPWPRSSEGACPWRRSTSRCWTSRTRTAATSSSGSPTTWWPASVTFPPEVSRWPPPSWATPLPSRRSLRGSLNSSPLCSGGRHSSTGTQVLRTNLSFLI